MAPKKVELSHDTRTSELEEQLVAITKRKARKRKRLQYGGTLEYGKVADQVTAEVSIVTMQLKKTRGSSNKKKA